MPVCLFQIISRMINKMKKLFTFLCTVLISNSLFAQIPNPGFETWDTTGGYNHPVSWDSPDSITNSSSVYPCEQGTPGAAGSFYLKLTSKAILTTVVPGVAVSGKINFTTFQPQSGFAYTLRPANLTGSWAYMASGSDQGHIMVLLTKWNSGTSSRDTVAFTDYALPGMVMSWASFSIPISYQSSSYPDSAIILLSASGAAPEAFSYLWVDRLAFSGTTTAGLGNAPGAFKSTIYPNPASSAATILYKSASGRDITICISDISGRSIMKLTQAVTVGENRLPVNISGVAQGVYVVRIIDGENTEVQKLVVE